MTSEVTTIRVWEDDPGAPPSNRVPILVPQPVMSSKPLPVGIRGKAAPTDPDQPGTANFRYWAAASALRRAADYWGGIVPAGTSWHSTVGSALNAGLDQGVDLNAFYDRRGLQFFHDTVAGITVYSGESCDVVCHELGHAVLDALRPQLWGVASLEVPAFHESFGDMSAMLTALQIDSLRTRVIAETGGRLAQSSTLSRLAEQLGWAIRQVASTAVEPDCLRNAANNLFYASPLTLPSSAPAGQLSSEPHSFSRVFTGAFLRCIAAVYNAQPQTGSAALAQAATDAGKLLVAAIVQAPVVSGYYAQIAAHMIAADGALFNGTYSAGLRAAFVRQGILSPQSATALTEDEIAPHMAALAEPSVPVTEADLGTIEIDGAAYGLTSSFTVTVPDQPMRFSVAGAALDIGDAAAGDSEAVAASFVDDLFRRGRVAVSSTHRSAVALDSGARLQTHEVTEVDGQLQLVRRLFD